MYRTLLNRKSKWQVVVYGKHSKSWSDALGVGAPVWRALPEVGDVFVDESAQGALTVSLREDLPTFILPLMENHIYNCPVGYSSLVPSKLSLDILSNKARFARYAQDCRLAEFCPKPYEQGSNMDFPCVLKRADLNCGKGVKIIYSEKDLEDALKQPLWRNQQCVLQSFIPGREEYTTNCVCKNGRILFQCSYAYLKDAGESIRTSALSCERRKFSPSKEQIQQIEQFLLPLNYSGPCNVDYKLKSNDDVVVLEINPRLGGSLMRSENVDDLRLMIARLLDEAIAC